MGGLPEHTAWHPCHDRRPMTVLTDLARHSQRRLGSALRAKVAGDDATERARVIWGKEGERWFTPEDPVWRVHADAAMFPGGVAALLLQSLHPLAMAGVAGHSGYKGDPWGRLQRTSHFLATTTFGTVEDAEAAIARVRGIHERVRGHDPRGRPYRASDPRLLRLGARRRGAQLPHRPPAVRRDPAERRGGRHLRGAVGAGGHPARRHRPADHGGRARRGPDRLPARARGHRRGAGRRAVPAARPTTAVAGPAGLRADRLGRRGPPARVGATGPAAACRRPGHRRSPAGPATSAPGRCAGRWTASPRSVSWPRGPEPARRRPR